MTAETLAGLLYVAIVIGLANVATTVIVGGVLLYQMRRRKPND